MGRNNSLYTLYKEMVEGFQTKENGLFEHGARCIMDLNPNNPFQENSDNAELFFQMKLSYTRWKNHGPEAKLNYRKLLDYARKLCESHPENPYVFDKEEAKRDLEEQKEKEREVIRKLEEKRKAEELKQKEEAERQKKLEEEQQKKKEETDDIKYVLYKMTEAYNLKDSDNVRQYAVHLMDIALENPFADETPEYFKFEEMKEVYLKHNIRKVHLLAEELCQIINYTEVEPKEIKKVKTEKPKKILGIPEEEKEKKSWFKFLHPWR